MTGKEKCRELREIRRKIAELNDIDLPMEDCPYEGPCTGTCPKCEEELRSLEDALRERRENGLDNKLKNIASDAAEKWNTAKDPFAVPETDNPSLIPIPDDDYIPELAGVPVHIEEVEIPDFDGPPTLFGGHRGRELAGVPTYRDEMTIPEVISRGSRLCVLKVEYRAPDGWEEKALYLPIGKDIILGSSENCDYIVRLPGFSARQLRIYSLVDGRAFIENLDCNYVYCNGQLLFGSQELGDKAEITVEDQALWIKLE